MAGKVALLSALKDGINCRSLSREKKNVIELNKDAYEAVKSS